MSPEDTSAGLEGSLHPRSSEAPQQRPVPSKPLPSSGPCLFPGLRAGAEGKHISRRTSRGPGAAGRTASLRARPPPPAWTRTGHSSCGKPGLTSGGALGPVLWGAMPARQWGAIPGGEGNMEGDRGGGRVDWSCLQQPTAWGDLEGHGVPIWLLLACRMGRTRRRLH